MCLASVMTTSIAWQEELALAERLLQSSQAAAAVTEAARPGDGKGRAEDQELEEASGVDSFSLDAEEISEEAAPIETMWDEMPTPKRPATGVNAKALAAVASEEATLAKAKALTQMALNELRQRSTDDSDTVGRMKQECSTVRGRIQKNVASLGHGAVIIRQLEAAAAQVADNLGRVRHARVARLSDLAVCERRLECLLEQPRPGGCRPPCPGRGGRSKSSQLRQDPEGALPGTVPGDGSGSSREGTLRRAVVEAVEVERHALSQARRELSALESDCSVLQEGLVEARQELARLSTQLRGIIRADHTQLLTGQTGDGDASVNMEQGWNFAALHAQNLQLEVTRLCSQSEAVIHYSSKECARVSALTRDVLAQCAKEQKAHRQKLEVQAQELEFAVTAAEWSQAKASRRPAKGGESSPRAAAAARAKSERVTVIWHELKATQRHLNNLIKRAGLNLQAIEACRRITAATAVEVVVPSRAVESHSGPRLRPSSAGRRCRTPSTARRDTRRPFGSPYAVPLGAHKPSHSSSVPILPRSGDRDEEEELATLEVLGDIQLEQEDLQAELLSCRYGLDRCAVWAEVLSELHWRVQGIVGGPQQDLDRTGPQARAVAGTGAKAVRGMTQKVPR